MTGCQDSTACNYDATATDAGYCAYADGGYDCDGNCLNDSDQDGICDEFEVEGCTDSAACNYASSATDDDGSCTYAEAGYDCDGNCLVDSDGDQICDQDEVTGCQDSTACNYDATATDAGYCAYADGGYDCDGNCLNDSDQDGICDELEMIIAEEVEEELQAAVDEASELFIAALANGDYCGDGTVWVPEWNECVGIPSCLGDLDQDGNRGTEDLLMLLSVYGTGCPEEYGCTDPSAENFDPLAVWDDGSCILLVDACQDETALTYGGVEYDLVVVDDACWFRQNLRTSTFTNGDAIAEIIGSFDWYLAGADDVPAYSVVTSDASLTGFYGNYYNGFAIADDRGLCPSDWHVATDGDWQALEVHLGMDPVEAAATGSRGTDEGDQLKASASDVPSWDGSNSIGMAMLPTGQRFNFGSISEIGVTALQWSSEENSAGASMLTREFNSDSSQIIRTSTSSAFGATVRCVKDPE